VQVKINKSIFVIFHPFSAVDRFVPKSARFMSKPKCTYPREIRKLCRQKKHVEKNADPVQITCRSVGSIVTVQILYVVNVVN